MAHALKRRFKMTIGRKIYVLIGFGFLGLLGNTLLDSRELTSGLDHQKQIELRHLTELALGIVKEEHAAAEDEPDLVAVPDRADAVEQGPPLQVAVGEGQVEDPHAHVEAIGDGKADEQDAKQRPPDQAQRGVIKERMDHDLVS